MLFFLQMYDSAVCLLVISRFLTLFSPTSSLSVSDFLFQVLMWIVTVILLVFVCLYVVLSIAYCIRRRQPQLKFKGEDKSLLSSSTNENTVKLATHSTTYDTIEKVN